MSAVARERRDTEALRARARAFYRDSVLPLEPRVQREGRSSDVISALQEAAKAAGLWQFDVPTEFGGMGAGLVGACIVAEEVERSPVIPFRQNDVFGPRGTPILYAASEEQRQRFLWPVLRGERRTCFAQTEPHSGSDPSSIRTTARRVAGEYLVNGVKRYIGGAANADFAQLICVVDRPDPGDGGRPVFACLLVDMRAPGVVVNGPIQTMMGEDVWEIELTNVRVPVADRVGEEGDGFALGQRWLTHGRIRNHGARCVGIGERALSLMIERSKSRVTFGAPLSERQAIQFYVADSTIQLEAARLLAYEAAGRYDNGGDTRDISYMVKILCVETAERVVDLAMQIHGAAGLTTEHPLEFFYRQLRSLRITEGATEVLRWRLGRNRIRSHA